MNKKEEEIIKEVSKEKISAEQKNIYDLTEKIQLYLDNFLKKFIEEFKDTITREDADMAVSLCLKKYLEDKPSLKIHYDIKAAAVRTKNGLSYEIIVKNKKENNE